MLLILILCFHEILIRKKVWYMTIKQALIKGVTILKLEKISTPKLKARLLLQYVLKKPRQYLIVYDNQKLTDKEEEEYLKYIELLTQGEPIEHITHQKEFMKLNFYVDENVLIPRPDTEVLVEEVMKIAKKIKAKKILDLCTGSGAIAVSLAKYLENTQLTALDISGKALDIAIANAKNNHVQDKITFVESNLFENLGQEKYDMIVSNPPYIRRKEIEALDKEVRKEPRLALDGGEDGLEFYRRIIDEGYAYLKYGGYICLEIGYDQKEEVMQLIEAKKQYSGTYCKKDLYDNDRVIVTKLR